MCTLWTILIIPSPYLEKYSDFINPNSSTSAVSTHRNTSQVVVNNIEKPGNYSQKNGFLLSGNRVFGQYLDNNKGKNPETSLTLRSHQKEDLKNKKKR